MTKMLRIPAVGGQLGRCRTALYDDVKAGFLPPPVKVGSRAVAWPENEIAVINAARVAGLPDAEIKAIAARLLTERKTVLAAILQQPVAGANQTLNRTQAATTQAKAPWQAAFPKARG